jgi:hypothetical protein
MMKFCKDCKWFDRASTLPYPKCLNPKYGVSVPENVDMVTGVVTEGHVNPAYASIAREYEHLCGVGAKGFVPK